MKDHGETSNAGFGGRVWYCGFSAEVKIELHVVRLCVQYLYSTEHSSTHPAPNATEQSFVVELCPALLV